MEYWSNEFIPARPRLQHSNPPLLRRCSCGREGDIVDVESELDMTSGETEIPADLAAALRAVSGAAKAFRKATSPRRREITRSA